MVQLLSPLPFEIPEDKRTEGAIAICVANYGICHGSFDYDISDGQIVFRMTCSYRDSALGEGLFEYMVMISAVTIDGYNDKLLMFAKGQMTIEEFINQESK